MGLIGPNGCGKSTLLKTIYRVNKASEGTIYIGESEITRMSNRQVAKKMAVVTQENDISFDFSVMEMMMIGQYAHRSTFSNLNREDEVICREALASVGMLEFAERSFLSLSGGEKQRVLIASAFARRASLIILDEPTNHLDIGYQFLILDIMALRYCDYVIAMEKGRIAATGKPQDVITEQLMRELFNVNAKLQTDEKGRNYFQYLGGILQTE